MALSTTRSPYRILLPIWRPWSPEAADQRRCCGPPSRAVCRLDTEASSEAIDRLVVSGYDWDKRVASDVLHDAAKRASFRVGFDSGFTRDRPKWEDHRADAFLPRHQTSWRDWAAFVERDWAAQADDEDGVFALDVARVSEVVPYPEGPEYHQLARVSGFRTADEAMVVAEVFMEAEGSDGPQGTTAAAG